MRSILALAIVMAWAARASAEPPLLPGTLPRPVVEWSSWFQLGYGYARTGPSATPLDAIAQPTPTPTPTPTPPDRWGFHAALGADVTFDAGKGGDLRVGPWLEVRGFDQAGVVAGGELVLERAPRSLDMFQYDGQGVLLVRAGGNASVVTGAVAWGYLAPWTLFDEATGNSRYMIGVRFVATATRSLDDPRDWSITGGLEVEPVGAIRYLLGIRSWY